MNFYFTNYFKIVLLDFVFYVFWFNSSIKDLILFTLKLNSFGHLTILESKF
jgi:hypothetical protein